MDLLAHLIRSNPKTALRPVLQQFTVLRLRYAQHDRFRFLLGTPQANGKLNLLFKVCTTRPCRLSYLSSYDDTGRFVKYDERNAGRLPLR